MILSQKRILDNNTMNIHSCSALYAGIAKLLLREVENYFILFLQCALVLLYVSVSELYALWEKKYNKKYKEWCGING